MHSICAYNCLFISSLVGSALWVARLGQESYGGRTRKGQRFRDDYFSRNDFSRSQRSQAVIREHQHMTRRIPNVSRDCEQVEQAFPKETDGISPIFVTELECLITMAVQHLFHTGLCLRGSYLRVCVYARCVSYFTMALQLTAPAQYLVDKYSGKWRFAKQ